jgi:uncharacterized protein YjbJ (UPF0337 family)
MEQIKLHLEAPWDEVKELLKENIITLTDDDLKYTPGKENELLDHLSKKLNKDKEAVKAYIESVSYNKGKAS